MSSASLTRINHQGTLNLTWYVWNTFFKYLYSFSISSGQKENRVSLLLWNAHFQIQMWGLLHTFPTSNSSPRLWNHGVPQKSLWKLIRNSDTWTLQNRAQRRSQVFVDNMLLRQFSWELIWTSLRTNSQGKPASLEEEDQNFVACTCLTLFKITFCSVHWFWK